MSKSSRLLLAAAVASATLLTSLSADAFWGPFSFMRWGGWGWGGPWSGYGWGYPGYGWGYPGYGWGYPGYGYGYPYGSWGAPYAFGWGVPYAYPATIAAAPAAPATSAAK